jgi:hypothetical protein
MMKCEEKGGKGLIAIWERETCILSFIPQPLSFRKVPRRPGAYYVNLKNAMKFSALSKRSAA